MTSTQCMAPFASSHVFSNSAPSIRSWRVTPSGDIRVRWHDQSTFYYGQHQPPTAANFTPIPLTTDPSYFFFPFGRFDFPAESNYSRLNNSQKWLSVIIQLNIIQKCMDHTIRHVSTEKVITHTVPHKLITNFSYSVSCVWADISAIFSLTII